jgi:low affinity Fe/Cu permease
LALALKPVVVGDDPNEFLAESEALVSDAPKLVRIDCSYTHGCTATQSAHLATGREHALRNGDAGTRPDVTTNANAVRMPSDVSSRVGVFDRFAGLAAHLASRAAFFLFCVLLVIVWLPSIVLIHNVDTWQLIINTATTIITFLMVALLQNSQTRSDQALQHKLNAIAQGLAELLESDDSRDELIKAVGLEDLESTSHNAA